MLTINAHSTMPDWTTVSVDGWCNLNRRAEPRASGMFYTKNYPGFEIQAWVLFGDTAMHIEYVVGLFGDIHFDVYETPAIYSPFDDPPDLPMQFPGNGHAWQDYEEVY